MLARRANAESGMHGSTHLVCPTPEGNKYNAAVRWKLPAVTADWLKTCADQLTLVDETPFLVGETIGKSILLRRKSHLLYTFIISFRLFFKRYVSFIYFDYV